jgi:membrane associated rhomboid family serine protease
LWQALTVLTAYAPPAGAAGVVARVLGALGANNPPSIRQYQEAVAAALLLAQPGLVASTLLPLLADVARSHACVASAILIAAQARARERSPTAATSAANGLSLRSLSPSLHARRDRHCHCRR